MDAKETAVQWLIDYVNSDLYQKSFGQTYISVELVQQALAMEKEQIVDAWSAGKKNPFIVQHSECCKNNGEQYYNETYNTK